jgi:HK97 family phage major capsid protein
MNPANWQTTRLLMDKNEQFYGGGPFTGAYGGPQGPVGESGQVTGAMDSIWNKPVIVTTAIGAGTAVVGSFSAAAQLFTRGGLNVEATNSHEDYFAKDLVALRAEKREALAVYRPAAFTVISELA